MMQKLKNLAGYIPEAMHLQEGPDIRSRIFATYLLTFSASNVCSTFAGDCFMRGCDTPNIFSYYCPILSIHHLQDYTRSILRLLVVESNQKSK